MLVAVLSVVAVVMALVILANSYMIRREFYDRSDDAKRLVHNAFRDAVASANFRSSQLALSLRSISKAISAVENVMLLYGTEEAVRMVEIDLPSVLRDMREQESRIMASMSEMYPDITPENPIGIEPDFNNSLSYANPRDDTFERPYVPAYDRDPPIKTRDHSLTGVTGTMGTLSDISETE